MPQLFREIKNNWELIWALAMRDLRVRYKRSTLGFLWTLLNPLLVMVVYIIVFSTILGRGMDNYSVFLISGIFPYNFFSQGITFCMSSMVGNSSLIKKVRIDKSVFPISAIVANLINFLLSLIAMIALLLAMHFPFHWTWVYFPIPFVCLVLITLGLGFLCATVNVFFRDVAHIVQILLSAGFLLSGIFYEIKIIPAKYQIILRLNPMLYVIEGFQKVVYYGASPISTNLALALIGSIVTLVIGYLVFRRLQDEFVYYI